MFKWSYHTVFEFSILDGKESPVDISLWNVIRPESLPQIAILEELFCNGFADKTTRSYLVPASEVLSISGTDRQILCLTSKYPFGLYIQSIGQLNQPHFQFKI